MPTAPDHDRVSRIELILRQVDTLPTLSTIATRLLEIAGAEDADLDRIVEIIESDPAMSARLLGLCRRAEKGLGNRITTVRRAVVMLGLEAVQAAALSVAVYDLMDQWAPSAEDGGTALQGSERRSGERRHLGFATGTFEREGFWRFSVAVGCASHLIAESHRHLGVNPDDAFVAGLLHGLGKLVLDLILPRSYARVIGLAERRAAASSEIERQLLGLDHHTAGKRLAEHWGLPHALQDTIWLCGQPATSIPDLPHRPLIGIVTVAATLCRHLHLGWSGDFNHPEPLDGPRGICPLYHLDPRAVEACIPRLHEEVLHRCKVLGIANVNTAGLLLQSIAAANRKLGRLSGIFEHRARLFQRQSRILAAIGEFHAAWRPGRGTLDTLGEIVRSASSFLGPGFFATVYQTREGEPWQLCQFASDGRLIRCCAVEPPGSSADGDMGRCASLAHLCTGSELSVGALALLPWLTDYLVDSTDLRNIHVLPLSTDDTDHPEAPSLILLHENALHGSDRTSIGPVSATWAAAFIAAVQHEGARRLGERLASANRSLSETQARLAETQPLARLGEMAAGAAHLMNNPLTIISGRAQLLASRLDNHADQALAAAIVEASRDLTDLITSLRLVADPPRPNFQPTPVMELIDIAIELAQARCSAVGSRERIRVTIKEHDAKPELDATLVGTAIAEVLINALQASSDAPVELSIQTAPANGRLEIVITDKGPGMSPRALQHAFDPFFSEKPAGRRTGLGLTRTRSLVELHHGEIVLESRPGAGVTATIRLPLRPPAAQSPSTALAA
jgi:signal transduction histidine kinase/HD-like signal output (HDOD) protein